MDDPFTASLRLIEGEAHYDKVLGAVRTAERSVWIATANLKELMVKGTGRRYFSVLEDLAELAKKGVELRLLHAAMPSRPFRDRFDKLPALVSGGLELRQCPRVHLKVVIVDGSWLYLGSANWTGAGLGVKNAGRRNFELGVVTRHEEMLDAVQGLYEELWRGKRCAGCRLKDACEMPIERMEQVAS